MQFLNFSKNPRLQKCHLDNSLLIRQIGVASFIEVAIVVYFTKKAIQEIFVISLGSMVKLESVNIPYKHFYVNKKLVHTDQFICMLVFEVLHNALLSYFILLGMRIWKSPILAILCMRKHPLFSTLCNNNNNNNPPVFIYQNKTN